MAMTSIFLLGIGLLVWIWFSVLTTVAVMRDCTLEPFQRNAQIGVAWLLPIFGAVIVLHFVKQHDPDAVPLALVPWPLRSLISSKQIPRNRNRDNYEDNAINLVLSRQRARKLEAARESIVGEDME